MCSGGSAVHSHRGLGEICAACRAINNTMNTAVKNAKGVYYSCRICKLQGSTNVNLSLDQCEACLYFRFALNTQIQAFTPQTDDLYDLCHTYDLFPRHDLDRSRQIHSRSGMIYVAHVAG